MAHPIEGQVVVLAGAKASVPLDRLPDLLERAADHLDGRRDAYAREFERAAATDERLFYLVPPDHWEATGSEIGFEAREADAVRRAHGEQLLRAGGRLGRREEFEHALDIRDAVVLGR